MRGLSEIGTAILHIMVMADCLPMLLDNYAWLLEDYIFQFWADFCRSIPSDPGIHVPFYEAANNFNKVWLLHG